MELLKRISTQLHPWLLIQDVTDKTKLVCYDVSEKKYYTKMIPNMKNKELCSSSYGWFILKDVVLKDYCLFNPITSQIIQLPSLPEDENLDSYLYLSPTDSNCHVIFFDEINKTIFFCKPKDTKFIQQELKTFGGFTMLGKNGYCCLLEDGQQYYASITFKESQILFNRLPVKGPFLDHNGYYGGIWLDRFLVESCGDLLLVCKLYLYMPDRKVYDIVIFKLDFEENKWIEIENIGSSSIFISSSNRAAIACNTQQVQKNTIYFLQEDERFFNLFNIETRGFSMTLPCSDASQKSLLHWVITDGSYPI